MIWSVFCRCFFFYQLLIVDFSPKIANSIDQGIKSFLLFIMEAHRSRGHVDTARLSTDCCCTNSGTAGRSSIRTGFSENSAAEYCRMKNSLNRGAYARHQTMDEIHQKGALSTTESTPLISAAARNLCTVVEKISKSLVSKSVRVFYPIFLHFAKPFLGF